MYSKYFWKTLKLQAIIHRKDKKRLIFSPLHIYSSIYIGAKICIITCIFSIYLCPVKKVFSIKDDTHRSMLSPEKARRSRSLISWRHSLPERSERASVCEVRSGHRGTAGSRKDTKEIILKSLEIQGIAEVIFIERCFL